MDTWVVILCILLGPFAWAFAVYTTAVFWRMGTLAGEVRFVAYVRGEVLESETKGEGDAEV